MVMIAAAGDVHASEATRTKLEEAFAALEDQVDLILLASKPLVVAVSSSLPSRLPDVPGCGRGRKPASPESPVLQTRMLAERDGVGQVDQTARQLRLRNVARDRDLSPVPPFASLDEHDPIAVTRGRGVREHLVVDREIDEEPVVQLAVQA